MYDQRILWSYQRKLSQWSWLTGTDARRADFEQTSYAISYWLPPDSVCALFSWHRSNWSSEESFIHVKSWCFSGETCTINLIRIHTINRIHFISNQPFLKLPSHFITHNRKVIMLLSTTILVSLSASAVALPAGSIDVTSLDKRVGNTGWVASYNHDNINCQQPYLSSAVNALPSWTYNQRINTVNLWILRPWATE